MSDRSQEAEIRAIAAALPEGTVTNDDLQREHPEWDLELVARRIGVQCRHIARTDETTLDLGHQACGQLFRAHPDLPENVDTLIFCTQSADYVLPPNATVLHGRLGLPERVAAFDLGLACSGFVYAASIARSMIRSGSAQHVLVVAGDTYSKYVNKGDRSARVLFGDGAAATWIAPAAGGLRIRDTACGTSGRSFETFIIPAGGCRRPRSDETRIEYTDESGNIRSAENIHMAGRKLMDFMTTTIPQHVQDFLRSNELGTDDIDLYVFHQASAVVLDSLRLALELDPERVYMNLRDIGNTVSASIPIAIRDAQAEGRLTKGDRVLLCGFGVGLSWGSVLLDVP
jgi:3-oxoacyl-[acyl-carrier-protein] synthase-3